MATPLPDAPPTHADPNAPTVDAMHRDVAFANIFRLEGIKTSIAIAGALLAFTVTFRPTLREVTWQWMMLVAWLMLGTSILGGLLNLYGWERFYISYRDHDWEHRFRESADVRKQLGKKARTWVTRWRSAGAIFQWVGLLGGVVLLAVFSWQNLPNVLPKAP
ncbi:MAG: hypothetical protein ABJE95_13275 [Byssovorax sp.]